MRPGAGFRLWHGGGSPSHRSEGRAQRVEAVEGTVGSGVSVGRCFERVDSGQEAFMQPQERPCLLKEPLPGRQLILAQHDSLTVSQAAERFIEMFTSI